MPSQHAVVTAVTTPFTAGGDVDPEAARELYRFAARTTGALLVGGTTAEFPALSAGERLSLIEIALAEAGPDAVIAHVGAADAHGAAGLARAAVRAGCRRLAALTPYYLPATTDELRAYFLRIREAAGDAALYGYLFPERSGIDVTPETFAGLAAASGMTGVKLSGTASTRVREHVAVAPVGFEVYSGDDRALAEILAAGGAGVVSGCAAALPEPFVEVAALVAAGRPVGAELQERVDRVVDALGPSIGRVKCAQHRRRLPAGHARMPVAEPCPETGREIAALVDANAMPL